MSFMERVDLTKLKNDFGASAAMLGMAGETLSSEFNAEHADMAEACKVGAFAIQQCLLINCNACGNNALVCECQSPRFVAFRV
jgi:hypothetical protein